MKGKDVSKQVIGAAIEVHRTVGPGLLESVYHACLAHEMSLRKIPFEQNVCVPVTYKGLRVSAELRADFLVDRHLVIELKSVELLLPVHEAQLNSYLRLTGCAIGLLINFNVPVLVDGIRRRVNNFPDSAPWRLCGEGELP